MLREGFGIVNDGGTMQSALAIGPMYCAAEDNAAGNAVFLDVVAADVANAVKVYWLPWKDKNTTVANRVDFENDCAFFMTPRLEGCRFVLTATQVLHVASNALGAVEGAAGSAARDKAEAAATGGAAARRLSISTTNINDAWGGYPYEKQAFVFGVRMEGTWRYKGLIYQDPTGADAPFGQWTTFMNP
jgi:hypothetical protein